MCNNHLLRRAEVNYFKTNMETDKLEEQDSINFIIFTANQMLLPFTFILGIASLSTFWGFTEYSGSKYSLWRQKIHSGLLITVIDMLPKENPVCVVPKTISISSYLLPKNAGFKWWWLVFSRFNTGLFSKQHMRRSRNYGKQNYK